MPDAGAPANGAAPASGDVRPTVDLRVIQQEQQASQAEQLRNEAALSALRGEPTIPAPPMGQPAFTPMLPPAAPCTALTIIADVRARCATLRAEILQLEAKRGELAMLERMIWATEGGDKDGT